MAITSQTSQQTSNATTIAVALPASVAAGDMLIVLCGLDVGASTSTNDQSFVELVDATGTDIWVWIGYKIAAGGETTVTLTHTSERANAIAYRIPAGEWHGTTVPEITSAGDGTSVNPDPPSLTPSWGSSGTTTYIAVAMLDDSAGVSSVSSWPSNYTSNQVTAATATSAASVHASIRLIAGSPENPGTYTVSPSEHWRTYTIGVRGASGTTIVPTSGTLTLTGQVPVIKNTVTLTQGTLTLTGQVPVIIQGTLVLPTSGTLTLTGQVPAVKNTITLTPGTLTLTGKIPVIASKVTLTSGTLTLTGYAPTVTVGSAPSELSLTWADETFDYIDRIKRNTLIIKNNTDRRNGTMNVTLVGTAEQLYEPGGSPNALAVPQSDIGIVFGAFGDILFDGIIRQVTPKDTATGNIEIALGCQDYTSLFSDYVIDPSLASPVRTTAETDIVRMQWLVDTFMGSYPGGGVTISGTSVVATMPSQDFTGMTVADAFAEVCKVTGADWYPIVGFAGSQVQYSTVGIVRALTSPYGAAATDLLTSTAHGLAVGDRVSFTTLTGGTGLATDTPYFVIASGLTANAFKVSTTSGGSAVNFTTDITAGSWMLLQDEAPFGLSDTPDDSTTFGYQDLVISEDSTERKDRVLIVGGEGYVDTFDRPDGYLYYDAEDIGTRTGIIRDTKITTAALGLAASEAYFADRGNARISGSATVWQPGIEPGMDVAITSANQLWDLHSVTGTAPSSPQTFRVSTITTKYPRVGELSYTLAFGSVPKQLEHAIYDIAGVSQSRIESIVAGVLRGYVGQLMAFPIVTPPTGFLYCDGSSLLRASYADLFAVIGTTFGSADGTHFNVPDYRGRFLLGVDGSHAIGTTGGVIDHTHTGPSHTHTGPSHTHTQPTHTHTGPSHTHTGPSHTHTGPSHDHSGTTSTHIGIGNVAGSGNLRSADHAHDISADGTGATGSGGTGATGSGGTGATGADGNDDTGSGGTGATGSGGTGASGTANPPYGTAHWMIRYA